MAKDGTNRGGPRPGTGPKRKPLSEKIQDGKAKKALVISSTLPSPAELTGEDIPPIKAYLKQKQKNGSDLCAEEVFREEGQMQFSNIYDILITFDVSKLETSRLFSLLQQ